MSTATSSARGLEDDLRRLKEATERQQLAKDQLIQNQQDTIEYLKKQRETLLDEREQRKLLLENLNLAKEEAIERLKSRVTDLEGTIAKQEALLEHYQQQYAQIEAKLGHRTVSSEHYPSPHGGNDVKSTSGVSNYSPTFQSRVQRSNNSPHNISSQNGFTSHSSNFQNVDSSYRQDAKFDSSRALEENNRFVELFDSLKKENQQLYHTFQERYDKVEKEMERLKSFYGSEIEREKNTAHKLIQENSDLKSMVATLLKQMKENYENGTHFNEKDYHNDGSDNEEEAEEVDSQHSMYPPSYPHYAPNNSDQLEKQLVATNQKLNTMKLKYIQLKDKYRRQYKKSKDLDNLLRRIQNQIQAEEARIQAIPDPLPGIFQELAALKQVTLPPSATTSRVRKDFQVENSSSTPMRDGKKNDKDFFSSGHSPISVNPKNKGSVKRVSKSQIEDAALDDLSDLPYDVRKMFEDYLVKSPNQAGLSFDTRDTVTQQNDTGVKESRDDKHNYVHNKGVGDGGRREQQENGGLVGRNGKLMREDQNNNNINNINNNNVSSNNNVKSEKKNTSRVQNRPLWR